VRGESFLLLAMSAARFGARPSKMVGLRDPVLALDFDLAATARLLAAERGTIANPAASPESEVPSARLREEYW
jgi:hypothetical protein